MTADNPGQRGYEAASELSRIAIELSRNYGISYSEALELTTTALNSVPQELTERRTRDKDLIHTAVSFQLGWTLALLAVAATPGLRPLLTLVWTYAILAVVVAVHYVLHRRRERYVEPEDVIEVPDFIGQHEPPPYPSSSLGWDPQDPEDPYR